MTEALSSLTETFKNVGVARAYGAAVTVNGEELVPVALVSFGFGGGGNAGSGDSIAGPAGGGNGTAGRSAGNPSRDLAAGGGGGGFVFPLGVYCRGRGGRLAFRPNTFAVLAGLVPLAWAVGFSVRGALRVSRR